MPGVHSRVRASSVRRFERCARSGTPATFSANKVTLILALACAPLTNLGVPSNNGLVGSWLTKSSSGKLCRPFRLARCGEFFPSRSCNRIAANIGSIRRKRIHGSSNNKWVLCAIAIWKRSCAVFATQYAHGIRRPNDGYSSPGAECRDHSHAGKSTHATRIRIHATRHHLFNWQLACGHRPNDRAIDC